MLNICNCDSLTTKMLEIRHAENIITIKNKK